jgi:exodeoxyribonuclease VII large subunit
VSEPKQEQRRTIPQTNALVRALVEQETLDYPFWTEGYVTRCHTSHLGHIYFDLTDDDHTLSCMIRSQLRGKLDFQMSNGLEIEVYGAIRVYEKNALVQIEVEKARLVNRPGFIIDASVKEQLAQKGLWPKEKRPLPQNIRQIALVTSKGSEGLHDFEDTYRQEHGNASIKLIDVHLQGQQAPESISEAIRRVNGEKSADVIALIRGGGRASELGVFNDLVIAEAICRSTIPIPTGIGHQRDDTLADQLADISTITPTAAASYLAKLTLVKTQTPRSSGSHWEIILGIAVVVMAIIIALLLLQQ